MFWAILIICASVLAGTLLAILPGLRDSWIGPVRTFALTAALSVVVVHLLPSSLATAGLWAILIFAGGLVAPELLGKAGELLWRARKSKPLGPHNADRRRTIALEAGYFGLLIHHIGDGLGLGAFTGEMYAASGSAGVVAALAGHTVPVVAIVVLSFDSMHGRGSALSRALGLAVASVVGVWLSNSIPHDSVAAASAYISAFVAGTLLHVVSHDLALDLPKSAAGRVADLVAAGLGIYVSFLGGESHQHQHGHEAGDATGDLFHVFADLSIETGPFLLIGLVIGALLTAWSPAIPSHFFRSRGALRDALRGTLAGAPLPLCSCSVIPISGALVARGAGPAMVVSFLLATPQLGVETLVLSVQFLGWEFALVRLLGSLALAFLGGVFVAFLLRKNTSSSASNSPFQVPQTGGTFLKRTLFAFDELLHHIGAWMILGVVAAALIEVSLPQDALSNLQGWFGQFLVVTLVAVPSYICAPSATPLAAVLIGKGVSPGAVLVGLLLGPAMNIATVVFVRRWFGSMTAVLGLVGIVLLSWALGGVVDAFLKPNVIQILAHHEAHHEHDVSTLWLLLAGLSALVLLRAVYRAGARGFLSTLVGEHGHSHDDTEHHTGHGSFTEATASGSLLIVGSAADNHEHCDHDGTHGHHHHH